MQYCTTTILQFSDCNPPHLSPTIDIKMIFMQKINWGSKVSDRNVLISQILPFFCKSKNYCCMQYCTTTILQFSDCNLPNLSTTIDIQMIYMGIFYAKDQLRVKCIRPKLTHWVRFCNFYILQPPHLSPTIDIQIILKEYFCKGQLRVKSIRPKFPHLSSPSTSCFHTGKLVDAST